MDAKKCDRCGKFYDIYSDQPNVVTLAKVERTATCKRYITHSRMELCKDCMNYIIYHLHNSQPSE